MLDKLNGPSLPDKELIAHFKQDMIKKVKSRCGPEVINK